MSQNERPGDLDTLALTVTDNQAHDILGGLAYGANVLDEQGHPELAEDMRDTRAEIVRQVGEVWKDSERGG